MTTLYIADRISRDSPRDPSGLVLELSSRHMRRAPNGDVAFVRQRQLRPRLLYFTRQALSGKRRIGNQSRRFGIADQVHVLDPVLLPLAVAILRGGNK